MQIRSLDPFDDSASTRLVRIGLTDFNGKPNTKTLSVFAGIFSALIYEHSMD